MNSRGLKKYRIESKERVKELLAFSRQYKEYKDGLESISEYPSLHYDGVPGRGATLSPVEIAAERREKFKHKMGIIELAALGCSKDPSIQKIILRVMTDPARPSYESLYARGQMYCCRDSYFLARQKYLWILDQLLG